MASVDELAGQMREALIALPDVLASAPDDVRLALNKITREWVNPENPAVANEPVDLPGGGPGPAPVVSGLSPDTAVANAPDDITMTVAGSGFVEGSVITFNGLDEPTTFVSDTEVSTGVKPSLFEVPATCPVGVRNPDGQTSGTVDFTFTEEPPARRSRSRS